MQELITPGGSPARSSYTYADYLTIDDGNRYEVIEGELVLTPSPGFIHQYIAARIESAIRAFVEENNLGTVMDAPFDVVLSEKVVLQPDVLFISRERYHLITEACLKGGPDLVVEVISPTSGRRDRIKKSRLYREYGVKEYWLVDPGAKTVEVLALDDRGWYQAGAYDEEDILASPLLPGLRVELKEIFKLPEGISL
ncbi:MAG: Uma2 family endonuclease [Peptococcaceae bacterium]|nr:Uma2 family endonuclease [Peptococcaceae bacterium]